MYIKNFDERNEIKKKTHANDNHQIIINTKDIWFVSLGCNVGREQDGKTGFLRPVLVIRRIGSLYFVVPLTKKEKKGKYYYPLESFKKGTQKSVVILSQGRVIDKKRFRYQMGVVAHEEMNVIKKLLKDMYLGEVL